MADNIEVVNEQPQAQAASTTTIPQEVHEQMRAALGMEQPAATTATTQESVVETKEPPVFNFDTLKEKFGYTSPEDLEKEVTELRAFKATPPKAEPIKFENEHSERVFRAIQAGKTKEVYETLAQQERLDSLTALEINKSNADEVIKMGMGLKYKDLSPQEIEYKFNKQFAVPKKPVQDVVNESDEDYAVKVSGWEEQVRDAEMNKIIEAKLMKPELEAAKAKLVLPEIKNEVDEDYVQYKKSLDDQSKVNEQIAAAYKAFTPKTIETKVGFKDESNKIDFEFQFEPDSESFAKTVDMATNINKFFDFFIKPDGTPDREGFLGALHFALNKEKYLMEAMRQSKNATIKAKLPDNTQGGLVRHMPTGEGEETELQKGMRLALAGHMR